MPVPGGYHLPHPGLSLPPGRLPVHQDLVGGVDGQHGPGKHEQHTQGGAEEEIFVI